MKNARRKLEVHMDATMSCKEKTKSLTYWQETVARHYASNKKKGHEDHIAGKEYNSMNHHDLVHKFVPVPQAMKIPHAKVAVDKE